MPKEPGEKFPEHDPEAKHETSVVALNALRGFYVSMADVEGFGADKVDLNRIAFNGDYGNMKQRDILAETLEAVEEHIIDLRGDLRDAADELIRKARIYLLDYDARNEPDTWGKAEK